MSYAHRAKLGFKYFDRARRYALSIPGAVSIRKLTPASSGAVAGNMRGAGRSAARWASVDGTGNVLARIEKQGGWWLVRGAA